MRVRMAIQLSLAALYAMAHAIAIAPDSLAQCVVLADALARTKDVAEEFATLDGYAKRRPDDHWAHYWLGQIAEKRGAEDVAREEYEAALKIDPKNPPARKAMESVK